MRSTVHGRGVPRGTPRFRWVAAAAAVAGLVLLAGALVGAPRPTPYCSPQNVAFSNDGKWLAATDPVGQSVTVIDPISRKVARRVTLREPVGVAWLDNSRLVVSERSAGAVAEVDVRSGAVARRITVGARPGCVTVARSLGLVLVANTAIGSVSVVRLSDGKETARIACAAEPSEIALTPDERLAIVTDLIPRAPATEPTNAAMVDLIDLQKMRRLPGIKLPPGSTCLRQAAVSPNGRWAYVAHTLGRFNLPTTQLDRGWVNTNSISVIDLQKRQVYATFLLDHPQEGSADPWGLALSPDGKTLWTTLSGVHRIARIDIGRMHELMAGQLPDDSPLIKKSEEWAVTARNIWQDIKEDQSKRSELVNDLAALYVADLITMTDLPGKGPRGLAISRDGKRLATGLYFANRIALLDPDCKVRALVPAGADRAADETRRGEIMFHDGTLCFQHWLSCATCHPDARTDGLNWDLLNDGMGNPKNTRSMLLAHKRGSMMSHGIREDYRVATTAGFRFILFREPEKGEPEAVQAYFRSLRPAPSPYRAPGGGLTARALRGRTLFNSPRTKCAECHNGAIYTDIRRHDVGTRGELDSGSQFVTSTLVEVWRTAPYLHDGSAVTLRDVLTKHNRRDRHGKTSKLSPSEIDDLAEYVLSL